jgi:hypothetical protein
MAEVEADQLREAVERMHGGCATLAQSVPVSETLEGKTVWEGVVHVFDLTGHPTATHLSLVFADRGKHEAAVLRGATFRTDQLAPSCRRCGDRCPASREGYP